MNSEIRIEVSTEYPEVNAIVVLLVILVSVTLNAYLQSFKAVWLIVCSVLGAVLVVAASWAKSPTVIWSDGTRLRWRFLRRKHSIRLDDITECSYEPYQQRVRGGYRQRIRLTLHTQSQEMPEIIFSDEVDANAVLNEKLGGEYTDIPLMQLYDYLRERGIGI